VGRLFYGFAMCVCVCVEQKQIFINILQQSERETTKARDSFSLHVHHRRRRRRRPKRRIFIFIHSMIKGRKLLSLLKRSHSVVVLLSSVVVFGAVNRMCMLWVSAQRQQQQQQPNQTMTTTTTTMKIKLFACLDPLSSFTIHSTWLWMTVNVVYGATAAALQFLCPLLPKTYAHTHNNIT